MNANQQLFKAIEKNDLPAVKKLMLPRFFGLLKAADIESRNKKWYEATPLGFALSKGHSDIAHYLIAQGANIHAKDNNGETPLLEAARNGCFDICKLLINKGADVNCQNQKNNATALHLAAYNGYAEICELLIANGIEDIDTVHEGGNTPLLAALQQGKPDVAKLLIAKGADIHVRTKTYNETPLLWAIGQDYFDVAKMLLNRGADPNVRTHETNNTPLKIASEKGNLELAEMLINCGAEVNALNADGATPLTFAVSGGHTEIVRLLIKNGANVNVVNNEGNTPLMVAVAGDDVSIIELLIEGGADINYANSKGSTALMFACIGGYLKSFEILIRNGADVNEKYENNVTPLHYAAMFNHADLVKILLEKGADVNVRNDSGNTPLMASFTNYEETKHFDAAKALVNYGADYNLRNYSDLTANDFANYFKCYEFSGFIKKKEADDRKVAEKKKSVAIPASSLLEDQIRKIIAQRKLRPLGNRLRLGSIDGEPCNDYRAQFRDKADAALYYDTFVSYATKNPPPICIEVMVAFTPNTIYAEKYAFILPYFNSEYGARTDYAQWARKAILNCNEVLMQDSYCSGNNYSYVPQSISKQGAVFKWTILPPKDFDIDSPDSQKFLTDPPDMGFDKVNIEGVESVAPVKPSPQGPWIGVVFEIEKFDEALYGRAATIQLFAIVGLENLAGCVIHGGDLLPDARYWCNAIRTSSRQQADIIASLVEKSDNAKLAHGEAAVIRHNVPVEILPFQGFVSANGEYVGI